MAVIQGVHGLSARARMTSSNLSGHLTKNLLPLNQGKEVSDVCVARHGDLASLVWSVSSEESQGCCDLAVTWGFSSISLKVLN